ncbi:MAG: MFS transporter [Oscillospiraceae bacterium]
MKQKNKAYPNDFKTKFGFFTISWVHGFATMVFSLFMQYLTDYSGIDSAIGKVGFAASFGTIVMLVTRIVDAVDDPLQAWIMDSAKETKFGKYRKFTLWSILMIGVGIVVMFSIPQSVKGNVVLLTIWVAVGYLLFEMGSAFNGTAPLVQKVTYDLGLRSKLQSLLRMGVILAVVPASFFIPIATAVNGSVGNMGLSFTYTCIVITAASCLLSLAGTACVKEPYRPNISVDKGEIKEEKLRIRDVLQMLKSNRPMWIHCVAYIFSNFAYAISSAVMVYFLKWFYCADMATGAVDNVKYASIYGIYAALSLIPNFLTPLVASFVIRKLKTVDRAMRIMVLLSGIGYGVIFVSYLLGILQMSPMVFIILMFLAGIPASIAVIPAMLMWTECADYAEYKTGKNMSAMVTAMSNLTQKAQTAIAVVIPGILLVAVGYSVNAETGAYAGDLSKLPDMVRNITLVITLLPMAVSVIAWFIYKFFYPITPELREKMTEELNAKRILTSEGEER